MQVIDRSKAEVISIEQFLKLAIDYRSCGGFGAQLAKLNSDFEHFHYQTGSLSGMEEVEEAYYDYLVLIRSGYSVVI